MYLQCCGSVSPPGNLQPAHCLDISGTNVTHSYGYRGYRGSNRCTHSQYRGVHTYSQNRGIHTANKGVYILPIIHTANKGVYILPIQVYTQQGVHKANTACTGVDRSVPR